MEVVEAGCLKSEAAADELVNSTGKREKEELRLKRKALEDALEKCRKALELLNDAGELESDDEDDASDVSKGGSSTSYPCRDAETDELHDMIKSQVGGPEFLQKIENAQASGILNMTDWKSSVHEEGSSWDVVDENDLWEGGNAGLDLENYVLVRQEDIADGIACFMAAYLLSLKQTKELTPNQLQDALRKTFSAEKRKGKLRKAWDGSRLIYNVASWSATAIGIYQNPAILGAASTAFWSSCRVVSRFF